MEYIMKELKIIIQLLNGITDNMNELIKILSKIYN